MRFDINKKEIDKMFEAVEVDTGYELARLKESLAELNTGDFVVHTPTNILLKNVRNKLSMNQLEFAELIIKPLLAHFEIGNKDGLRHVVLFYH